MRIAVWCSMGMFFLLSAFSVFAQSSSEAMEAKDAYWKLIVHREDRWYRPNQEVLRAAYEQLQLLIARNPSDRVLIGQKLRILIEMGEISRLQSFVEELRPYAESDLSIKEAIAEVERYLQSRRDGVLRTFLKIIQKPWEAAFWNIFGSTVFFLLLAVLVTVLARWRSDRNLGIVSVALLGLAWATPVARLFSAIVVGSPFPLRRYDTQLLVTLSVLLWGGYTLVTALYFRRYLSVPHPAQKPRWVRMVLTGVAILTMTLWELHFMELGSLGQLPKALVATVQSCSGFFVIQSAIHFANNVPLSLMTYGVFYAPIRARFGAPTAMFLVFLFCVSEMAVHLSIGWHWLLLSAARFAIALTTAYEGHPSPLAPACILSLGSLMRVTNAIVCSQGWNPNLLW